MHISFWSVFIRFQKIHDPKQVRTLPLSWLLSCLATGTSPRCRPSCCKVRTTVISILQIRKLKNKEAEGLDQGQTANKCQGQKPKTLEVGGTINCQVQELAWVFVTSSYSFYFIVTGDGCPVLGLRRPPSGRRASDRSIKQWVLQKWREKHRGKSAFCAQFVKRRLLCGCVLCKK